MTNPIIQDGTDAAQLIAADWWEDQGHALLASSLREEISGGAETPWSLEWRGNSIGDRVGGIVSDVVGIGDHVGGIRGGGAVGGFGSGSAGSGV